MREDLGEHLNGKLAEALQLEATSVQTSPWIDCARDIQASARRISDRFATTGAGDLIRTIANERSIGINTLRRYLALAEFVDRRVLPYSGLEPEEALRFVRKNFSGLETISRIEKINPNRVNELLTNLEMGKITTRYLEDELETERSANPASTTARRGQAISSRSKELKGLEGALQTQFEARHDAGKFVRIVGPSFVRANWAYLGPHPEDRTGYLSPHATSEKGFEDAFIQACFTSRFFRSFYLILPASEVDKVGLIDNLNARSKAGIGLVIYTNKHIGSPICRAEPRVPKYVDLDCQVLYSQP
jgi:hypothetical protein